jgi:hypothetical protein
MAASITAADITIISTDSPNDRHAHRRKQKSAVSIPVRKGMPSGP